jgi:peroxiredoxin
MLWGAWVILFPQAMFRLAGMAAPNYPAIWQCLGMVVGVYGLAYCLAARDPLRHWAAIAAGFVGKLCGVAGFLWAWGHGELPLAFGAINLTNDLFWLPPFYFILRAAYLHAAGEPLQRGSGEAAVTPELLARFKANTGQTLDELSRATPLLVVFLRHLNCVFCREALADLARQRPDMAARGIGLALVHQASDQQARGLIERYGLGDVPRISDPARELYRAFGLRPGSLRELLGAEVWQRGLLALLFGWHLEWFEYGGKANQLPGVFLVYDGQVVMNFKADNAGARPDYSSAEVL